MNLPFTRNAIDTNASGLFDQTTFYTAFERDLLHANREVIIESPFISISRTKRLLPIIRRLTANDVTIVINTRDPIEHESLHSEYASQMINELQLAGAIVLFTVGHHRKLAIIDERILWEGSLNILSHYDSCEVMRRTVSSSGAIQMKQFINIARFMA